MPGRTPIERYRQNTDRIDYDAVHTRFPWLTERDRTCIVSTDADGMLCGLMMSHFLNWRVVGFYDSKLLVFNADVSLKDAVFLDVEILRANVRSVGQHMLAKKRARGLVPDGIGQCFAINEWRQYDHENDFRCKYPLSTAHFLLAALAHRMPITLSDTGIVPFHFADGSLQNTFGYTENALDWMRYLRFDEKTSPFYTHFHSNQSSIAAILRRMVEFWSKRDELSAGRGDRGDRITITERGGDGSPVNLVPNGNLFDLAEPKITKARKFIDLLASHLGWSVRQNLWSWHRWRAIAMNKQSQGNGSSLSDRDYREALARSPVSMAITAGGLVEYSVPPEPDPFL